MHSILTSNVKYLTKVILDVPDCFPKAVCQMRCKIIRMADVVKWKFLGQTRWGNKTMVFFFFFQVFHLVRFHLFNCLILNQREQKFPQQLSFLSLQISIQTGGKWRSFIAFIGDLSRSSTKGRLIWHNSPNLRFLTCNGYLIFISPSTDIYFHS